MQKLKFWPPTIAPQNFNFSLSSEEKKYNFDVYTQLHLRPQGYSNPSTWKGHFRHLIRVSDALELVKLIKCFGLHYAPDILRWSSNPTVQIFPSIFLGGITSPLFSVSTIKASKRHSFLFSSQFAISERSHLYTPYSSDYSSYLHKRDFKDPQKTRRLVRILSYVSFVLQTSFIFSANLLG